MTVKTQLYLCNIQGVGVCTNWCMYKWLRRLYIHQHFVYYINIVVFWLSFYMNLS